MDKRNDDFESVGGGQKSSSNWSTKNPLRARINA